MADMIEPRSPVVLMDLPVAMIDTVISNLNKAEKIIFMAACRTAALLTMPTGDMTLKVTRKTKFNGIRKVLDTVPANIHLFLHFLTHQEFKDDEPVTHKHLLAMDVIMGTVPGNIVAEPASNCCWEGITKATIQGCHLKSLLPHFIAISCPHLAHFKVVGPNSSASEAFTTEPTEALPLTLCSSLHHLELEVPISCYRPAVQLPPAYHSPDELRQNLPSITTLIMQTPCIDLIEAFATQLTRLDVRNSTNKVDEAIRQCSSLAHLSVPAFVLPEQAAPLQSFKVSARSIEDSEYRRLLQLPNLSTVQLRNVKLSQDWSDHECFWQELCLEDLNFNSLPLLSLNNVQRVSMGRSAVIYLPSAESSHGRALVQRAVDKLSSRGKIPVNENSPPGSMTWRVQENSAAAADLISMAAQLVGPFFSTCNLEGMQSSRSILRAVSKWGQHCLEEVSLMMTCEVEFDILKQPHVWKALSQLHRLQIITVNYDDSVIDEDLPWHTYRYIIRCGVVDVVHSAAQHWVIPCNRSLKLRCMLPSSFAEQEHEREKEFVRADIQKGLPSGSHLASIESLSNATANALVNEYVGFIVAVAPSQDDQVNSIKKDLVSECVEGQRTRLNTASNIVLRPAGQQAAARSFVPGGKNMRTQPGYSSEGRQYDNQRTRYKHKYNDDGAFKMPGRSDTPGRWKE